MKNNDVSQQPDDTSSANRQQLDYYRSANMHTTSWGHIWDALSRLWVHIKHLLKLDTSLGSVVKIGIIAGLFYWVLNNYWQSGNNSSKFVPSSKKVTKITLKNNQFAPVDPKDLQSVQVSNFINKYSKVAITEMDKYGIPASISMGQAIIESRAGQSILATHNNNFFGVKCFSKNCPKGHCTNFTDDHHKDFFRKYPSVWDSWREHSTFLTKERYQPLFKLGKNYKAWAKGLQTYGYATDPDYEKKLVNVIERYNLAKLDEL